MNEKETVTMERSLVLIKPDAIQRALTGEIICRLEKKGLKTIAMKMLRMDRSLAQSHYAVHDGKPFFDNLVDFIISSPIIAIVFEGSNAVEIIRHMMGDTDPARAEPGTIRGDFGIDIGHNLIHGSDSRENASKEIDLFFSPEEICDYDRPLDAWIY